MYLSSSLLLFILPLSFLPGKLKDCLKKFNISSFKKEWKLEELVQNWDGYEDYIFNDSESDESYDDIFGEY